jgi:uncharacterized protein (TIGR00251 family)
VKLTIKAIPGASSSGIVGWLGDALKVRVAALPERGKANSAIESIICEALELPKGSVQVVSGTRSPRKTLEITGLSDTAVLKRLGKITS